MITEESNEFKDKISVLNPYLNIFLREIPPVCIITMLVIKEIISPVEAHWIILWNQINIRREENLEDYFILYM